MNKLLEALGFKNPPPLTHIQLAELELEASRVALLERRKEKERAEAAVRALETGVERLVKYVNDHGVEA